MIPQVAKIRASRHIVLVALGLLCLSQLPAEAYIKWFWDDQLTHAKSGVQGNIMNPGDTIGKSGVSGNLYDPNDTTGKSGINPTQNFYIPPTPQWEDVDPHELDDYRRKDYTPYALAQLSQDVLFQGSKLKKGYYEIKLGLMSEGSPRIHLPEADPEEPLPSKRQRKKIPPLEHVLVFKQLGKVMAVIQVQQVEVFTPPKKQGRAYRKPLAAFEQSPDGAFLRYIAKKKMYIIRFEPTA